MLSPKKSFNNSLIKAINNHDIISFDIFDTLLKRNVMNPSDVFDIVQATYNKETSIPIYNFKTVRINKEIEARKQSSKEDINIYEIYEFLPYDESIKNKLLQLEFQIEQDLLQENPEIKKIFNYAQRQNKTILIISDMYLPKYFLEKILKREGYNHYDNLYISSEIGLTKSSSNLYKYIIKKNNYSPQQILHIGDNLKSDYFSAKRIGIHSYKIRKYKNNLSYWGKNNIDSTFNIVSSFINNNITTLPNKYQQIGYETFGTFLYGLCKWIHEYYENNKSPLYFLSRDGQLIYDTYIRMYPNDKAYYMYISRRSLTVPLIHKIGISEALKSLPKHCTIKQCLNKMGLDYDEYIETLQKYKIDSNEIINRDTIKENPQFVQLFQSLENIIYYNSHREYIELKKYLDTMNFNNNITIIDLGWHGTIQKSLKRLFNEYKIPTQVKGLYVGIELETNSYGYIWDITHDITNGDIAGYTGLLETLFSANHGSVKSYKNAIINFYDFEFDYNEQTREDYIRIQQIQIGAKTFINQLTKSQLPKYIKWSPILSIYALNKLGSSPNFKDLKLLGNLTFFDNKITYLAKPDFSSFNKFKISCFDTTWRIGFLKRMLLLPLPYNRIYKNIHKRIIKKNSTKK